MCVGSRVLDSGLYSFFRMSPSLFWDLFVDESLPKVLILVRLLFEFFYKCPYLD